MTDTLPPANEPLPFDPDGEVDPTPEQLPDGYQDVGDETDPLTPAQKQPDHPPASDTDDDVRGTPV